MGNTVLLSDSGIEVYQSDIDILTEEYIATLPDETMIYKSACFNGLLLYIYNNKLKHIIDIVKQNKGIKQYNNDYELLDSIFFGIYLPLTCKYNIVPTILSFSCFVHISNVFLSEIKNGIHRDGSKVKPETSETAKKWYQVCESALADKAFNDNGIGAIFGLKSNYSWRETSPEPPQLDIIQQSTPEEISARYQDAKRPELPELE